MVMPETSTIRAKIYEILEQVSDPEVPVLSILDLGIVRDVLVKEQEIEIIITPTYSGCPAMDMISIDIRLKMIEFGFTNVKITQVLSPAWTTDWMTTRGKEKLSAYGVAPPLYNRSAEDLPGAVICPQCKSNDTVVLSQFGSTACKALYQCNSCKEPFDYFKCH